MEIQSLEFVQLLSYLAVGIKVKQLDEAQNIVETAIVYRDFGSWTKYTFHHPMLSYGPQRLMFEQS